MVTREDRRSAYSEKLKDPRWQKKRLVIFDRDSWRCQGCGDSKNTLHVHHVRYSGKNPWEAKDSDLITLCEECHEREGHDRGAAESMLLQALHASGFAATNLEVWGEAFRKRYERTEFGGIRTNRWGKPSRFLVSACITALLLHADEKQMLQILRDLISTEDHQGDQT